MNKFTLIVASLGLFLICNEGFSQSKKSKKNKKSKAPVENGVAQPATPNGVPSNVPPRNNEPTPTPTSTPRNDSQPTPSVTTPTPTPEQTPRPTPVPIPTPTPTPEQFPTPRPTPSAQPNNTTPLPPGVQQTPEQSMDEIVVKADPIITNVTNGSVNWTEQYVEAIGTSVIDNERFKVPAQARAMAERGAVVVAQRNLLEIIKGVNVTSETTVQDMITTSDFIYTRIDGVVKGAQTVGPAIEKNGLVEVRMRIPLYDKDGLAPIVAGNIPPVKRTINNTPSPIVETPDAGAVESLDKLVFNFKGKKIDPSMFPVIVDQNNNLVFDYSKLYDPKTGKFPKIVKTTDQLLKDLGYKKGIQVLDVLSADKGKIVIDNKNLKKVNWKKISNTAAKIGKFLLMLI